MVKVKTDMTGWIMSEHGVPDSRLIVVRRDEDYIKPNGEHYAKYLCKCTCGNKNLISVSAYDIKSGNTKSCGCLKKDSASVLFSKKNKRDLSGEYGIIWSNNTNEEIYFDLEDADKILEHTWTVNKPGYAVSQIGDKKMTMHNFLGFYRPDHHNRNKLDNRKENLVQCTEQENNRNKSIMSNNTSGFIGVDFHKQAGKWRARIHTGEKEISLGLFVDKKDAIIARLKAEKEYFGDFSPQRHLFEEYGIL